MKYEVAVINTHFIGIGEFFEHLLSNFTILMRSPIKSNSFNAAIKSNTEH